MYVLALVQYNEHSGYDWEEEMVIVGSQSKEKLEKFSIELQELSKEFIVKLNEIRYSRVLTMEERLKKEGQLMQEYPILKKYELLINLSHPENELVIKELEMI